MTVVQVLALWSCFWGPGNLRTYVHTYVISSSESSVNNWWESDGPMKGIYQGNEFDVEGPRLQKKKKKKKVFMQA